MRLQLSKSRTLAILLGWILCGGLSSLPVAAQPNPPITGSVPFLYYHDLEEAANWYEHKLGLRRVVDEGWVVVFELTPTAFIGLVNATGGTLRPAEDKGVLLSIETHELEAWHRKLKGIEGANVIQDIEVGAKGMIEEFRLQDPGGYIVEIFRWRDRPCSHAGRRPDKRAARNLICPSNAGHTD